MAELSGLPRLADIGPFLGRLVRLDPAAPVRLRPAGPAGSGGRAGSGGPAGTDRLAVWGRVPWQVLVCRTVPVPAPVPSTVDITVPAKELLDGLGVDPPRLPRPRDDQWRWALPGSPGRAVESVPAAEVLRLGAAAAATLRSGTGRVGERMLRDALLDHVAIEVRADDIRVEVRQALVQAMLRMGFVTEGVQGTITVRTLGDWVALEANAGSAWVQNRAMFAISILR
jgi:hypothetical protein